MHPMPGWTPIAARETRNERIHECVISAKMEEVVALVEQDKSVVNLKGSRERTPLMMAARWGHLELLDFLVKQGAELEATDDVGRTALLWASEYGRAEGMKLLLDLGANPNVRDIQGMVPLHHAANRGHPEAVELLLAGGADPTVRDSFNMTPRETGVNKKAPLAPLAVRTVEILAEAEQRRDEAKPSA